MALVLVLFQSAFAEVGDVTVSEVEFKDPFGRSMDGPPGGTQLLLSATLTNNNTKPLPYVAFIELRNSDGVTIYLEFHKGVLDPGVPSNIASSWTPEKTGEYELRVFAISDFQHVEVLSQISSNKTTIS